MTGNYMDVRVEQIKPGVGALVYADRSVISDNAFAQRCLELIDKHGALLFPKIALSDEEQLAFTDKLGVRVNFTKTVAGGDAGNKDVYTITLDPKLNPEPEYVLGTFFWHMDGLTVDIPPPKASVLSCRRTAPKGGQTGFANTYTAYEALPAKVKAEL